MSYEALKAALAAGPTSAIYTHPRDDNKWFENEQFALACDPATIRALLKDAERYRRWREGFTSTEVDPLLDMLQRHAWTPDEVDSFIDAAMGEQA